MAVGAQYYEPYGYADSYELDDYAPEYASPWSFYEPEPVYRQSRGGGKGGFWYYWGPGYGQKGKGWGGGGGGVVLGGHGGGGGMSNTFYGSLRDAILILIHTFEFHKNIELLEIFQSIGSRLSFPDYEF